MQDWPEWFRPGCTLEGYKAYVTQTLEWQHWWVWQAGVCKHGRPVQYAELFSGPCRHLQLALGSDASWESLIAQRSLSRYRAAVLNLGHRDGQRTSAQIQVCIACGMRTARVEQHCIALCPHFKEHRQKVYETVGGNIASPECFTKHILSLGPDSPGYSAVATLARAIDVYERYFWRGRY